VKLPEKIQNFLRARPLTPKSIGLALGVAVVADALQFFLGPLGWAGVDQAIDFVAMGLCLWLLGFHVLLLPTFVVKLIPVVDELPTWTACVIAVIALRKHEQNPGTAPAILLPKTNQETVSREGREGREGPEK
jgi:hypothetical protein